MRQSALLRSGTGLGLPGTARDIAHGTATAAPAADTRPAADDRHDHFVVRNGVHCAGVHLIVDVYDGDRLDDIEHIESTLRACVEAAGATLLHIHLHRFQPTGVSGVAVLAESHISIHTWPEARYAALDVFMCGNAEPDACIPILRKAFSARRIAVSELLRGQGT
ncbi:adenosylmethionine decarboxylase [Rhodovulum sp. PH10]|uniref:adenosylmethionine decarboxylase n=1 Tax=Rhodovulum sp. PH10 TaxID=1187851 RepID=UPI000A004A4B|nr:adenosylmethionine decarboxylase [Rhodovulum sp. PH10]